MVINILKIITIILFSLVFIGCPNDDYYKCWRKVKKDGLMIVSPLQETYNQGDTITLKLNIPSVNNYFGNEINLFLETGGKTPYFWDYFMQISGSQEENDIILIKGNRLIPEFELFYDSVNKVYELEVQIVFNKTGIYSFIPIGTVFFPKKTGTYKCGDSGFIIHTNIQGWYVFDESKEVVVQ